MGSIIKYGMSRNYLPDWSYQDALREIYQNFQDYGEFKEEVSVLEGFVDNCKVRLCNDFVPDGYDFLKIGESGKRDDVSTVGKHGEGLKMAAMVLARNGCSFCVSFGGNFFKAGFYEDEFLGECFGFRKVGIADLDMEANSSFEVSFVIPKEEFDHYRMVQLDDENILHTANAGQLLNKPEGEVYVGGHFVGVVKGLKYAYNFNPKSVPLDRDRKVPGTFDVHWAASQILKSWDGLSVEDMSAADAKYMSSVPPKVAKKFKPELIKGNVVFRSGEVQASKDLTPSLMSRPENQKRIARMKYNMSRKRVPHSILKEFFDAHKYSLTAEGKLDFEILLKKAKNWRP